MRDVSKLVFVVDIDGTINEMVPPFAHERVEDVGPVGISKEVLRLLVEGGAKVLYLTGRQAAIHARTTSAWLDRHGFPASEEVIYYDAMLGEWTWSRYIKFKLDRLEVIRAINPGKDVIVVDDNERVVQAAREKGFMAFRVMGHEDWMRIGEMLFPGRFPA